MYIIHHVTNAHAHSASTLLINVTENSEREKGAVLFSSQLLEMLAN